MQQPSTYSEFVETFQEISEIEIPRHLYLVDIRICEPVVPSMSKEDFERLLYREPKFFIKSNAAGQLSDLVVYPVVKGMYDPEYPPYKELRESGRLVDVLFDEAHREVCGIKYSCFDGI